MIQRKAYERLLEWKKAKNRKPILLRGARQVGKTTLIKQFSGEFENYIELNLEREADKKLFEIDNIDKILNATYLLKGVSPRNGDTLLFIDEIQESPKAIQLLRYFYEEKPELFVIAAGSLLEFAMKKVPSFPVGRVEYIYLHPVNFVEFLGAIKNNMAKEILKTVPIPDYAHETLLGLFHDYALIGGMPEVVNNYFTDKNIAALSKTYHRLWQAYKDDVEKYAKNDTERKVIRHVIDSAPSESNRIKFEGFGNSNYRSREVGDALRSLDLAKIIRLIYPTTSIEPPIATEYKKRPRLQFLDTGMLNHILLLQGELIGLKDLSDLYRGRIIEHLVYQEIISIHEETSYQPHFWTRESKDSNSEVDLVYRYDKFIIPIETKSGKQGRLRSLHQFVERCNHPYAIRLYAGEYKIEETKTPYGVPYLLMNLPYYLASQIPEYLQYFIRNYPIKA
jgi:predicted AAA+ superfamily ATPase